MAKATPPRGNKQFQNENNPTVADAINRDVNRMDATAIREKAAEKRRIDLITKQIQDAIANNPKVSAELAKAASKSTLNKSMEFTKNLVDMYSNKLIRGLFLNHRGEDDVDKLFSASKRLITRNKDIGANDNLQSGRKSGATTVKLDGGDIAKETTQAKVMDNIINLKDYAGKSLDMGKDTQETAEKFVTNILDVTDKLTNIDEKLEQANKTFDDLDNKITMTYDTEKGQYDLLKETLEIARAREVREEAQRNLVAAATGGEIEPLAVPPGTPIEVGQPKAWKELGTLGKIFRVVTVVADILNPFKKIILGGFLVAAAFGLVDSIEGMDRVFTAIGEVFTKAFDFKKITGIISSFDASAGIFNETLRIINEIFSSNFGFDVEMIKKIFESTGASSGKIGELLTAFGDIFNNQLVPAFNYLVKEVFIPLVEEIAKRIKQLVDYFNEEGPGIVDSLRAFAAFAADVLVVFFRDILPPVLDVIGAVFKVLVSVIKEVYMILTYFAPAIKEAFFRTATSLKLFFTDLAAFFTDVSSLVDNWSKMSWTDRLAGINKMIGAVPEMLIKFFLRTLDNLTTFVFDALGLSEAFGRDTKFSLGETIKNKVNEFINAIVSVIPTMDDIISILRAGADKLHLGWVVDKILGTQTAPEVLTPETSRAISAFDVPVRQKDDVIKLTDAIKNNSAPSVVIMDNSSKTVQGNAVGGNSSSGGVARTTPRVSPAKQRLYGGGAW